MSFCIGNFSSLISSHRNAKVNTTRLIHVHQVRQEKDTQTNCTGKLTNSGIVYCIIWGRTYLK
jgi:hypothetical protein